MDLRGDGMHFRVEHCVDDEDGTIGLLIEVTNVDEGMASIVLEREDVEALHAMLSDWLVDTEPDPDIPGRPE